MVFGNSVSLATSRDIKLSQIMRISCTLSGTNNGTGCGLRRTHPHPRSVALSPGEGSDHAGDQLDPGSNSRLCGELAPASQVEHSSLGDPKKTLAMCHPEVPACPTLPFGLSVVGAPPWGGLSFTSETVTGPSSPACPGWWGHWSGPAAGREHCGGGPCGRRQVPAATGWRCRARPAAWWPGCCRKIGDRSGRGCCPLGLPLC